MTKKYFETMKKASLDPKINFRVVSIELYDEDEGIQRLIAGEIGYLIGRVYTSLSGFYELPDAGTVQLVCLGRWLELKGYAFWSLGHCYSPCMDYKRQLGHRVYPRKDFLRKLRLYRGCFREECHGVIQAGSACFSPLQDGEQCDLKAALEFE